MINVILNEIPITDEGLVCASLISASPYSMFYPSNFYTIIIENIIINDADSIIMGVQTMSTGTDPADAQLNQTVSHYSRFII